MLKRKAGDDACTGIHNDTEVKKPRTSSMDDMKSKLDAMLKKAQEHHESARIAAIDKASALEEELNDANEERETTEKQIQNMQNEYNETCSYLETIENSDTMKMLHNASAKKETSPSNDINILHNDNDEVQKLLKGLREKNANLHAQIGDMKNELVDMRERCTVLSEDFTAAQDHVETITNIGEHECAKKT